MEEGEDGILLSIATVRRGAKSGMLMLLEDQENGDQKVFNLHNYCVPQFVFENYDMSEWMGDQLCPNCEEKLSGYEP